MHLVVHFVKQRGEIGAGDGEAECVQFVTPHLMVRQLNEKQPGKGQSQEKVCPEL